MVTPGQPDSGARGRESARDGVPSLRDDRDADDAALDWRLDTASNDPDAAGAALLARLGLRTWVHYPGTLAEL